ncbi:hypothetical protein AAHH79_41695, partial [Burkholderia pseudomallei]
IATGAITKIERAGVTPYTGIITTSRTLSERACVSGARAPPGAAAAAALEDSDMIAILHSFAAGF